MAGGGARLLVRNVVMADGAEAGYRVCMATAAKVLEEAMQLTEDEREDLAARLLDSLETPPGISIDDREELEQRAADARRGAPGVPWDELKRDLLA